MSKRNLPLTINPASRRKACFPEDCMRTATMSLLFVERISQESTILRNKHKRKYREITVPMGSGEEGNYEERRKRERRGKTRMSKSTLVRMV